MMDAIDQAAEILAEAYRGGLRPVQFPSQVAPRDVAEAHAIQRRLAERLGQDIVGWKVGKAVNGMVMRGGLLRPRVLQSPAEISAATVPLLGIEPEIAFRLDRTLDRRRQGYTPEDIRQAVSAFVAIEVVDSRFASYHEAPFMHRLADFMSNGALICGDGSGDWRTWDFTSVEVIVRVNGNELSRNVGGHASGDPLLPAIQIVNDLVRFEAIQEGTILTTGTFAGLQFVGPGSRVEVEFSGFGSASVSLTS